MNKKRLLAVVRKMKDKRGNEAVSFLLTTAMLLCIFSTIVMAFCYITQSYHANYLCREVTRRIEVCGEYNETEVTQYLAGASNSDLKNPKIKVDAAYWKEQKIQLRDNFQVTYTADYPIKIVQMGSHDLSIDLPIQIKLTGMSEKYWKDGAADSSTVRPKPEQSVELPLNVESGNQVILPDPGFVLSSVTVLKPEDLLPENIRDGMNIGGVTGTLKEGPVIPTYEGSYTITENGTIPLAGKKATQDFMVDVKEKTAIKNINIHGSELYISHLNPMGGYHNVMIFSTATESNLGKSLSNTNTYLLSASAIGINTPMIQMDGQITYSPIEMTIYENGKTVSRSAQIGWTNIPNTNIATFKIDLSEFATDCFNYTAVIW